MSRLIQAFVILFQLVLASSGSCNQEKLDADRTRKLQTLFESIQHGSKTELAACLPGLSEEEASKMLKKISEHWGDVSKLVHAGRDPGDKWDKGRMKTIVQWGSESTQVGKWFTLSSPEAKETTVMRIGLLFPKGSSEARQILAVEWDVLDVAPDERPQGIKQ